MLTADGILECVDGCRIQNRGELHDRRQDQPQDSVSTLPARSQLKRVIVAAVISGCVLLGLAACSSNPTAGVAGAVPLVATVTLKVTTTKTVSTTQRIEMPAVTLPASTLPAVTVTAPAPVPATVLVTATVPANPATPDPSGPKNDGNYMIGSQITPGTWQCAEPETSGLIYWKVSDSSGGIVENGLDAIAYVSAEGSSVLFDDCRSTWTLVG